MFSNSPFNTAGNASPMPTAGRGRGREKNNYNNINSQNNHVMDGRPFGNKNKRGGGRGGQPSPFQNSAFSAAFDNLHTNTTQNTFAGGSSQFGFNNSNNSNNRHGSTPAFGNNIQSGNITFGQPSQPSAFGQPPKFTGFTANHHNNSNNNNNNNNNPTEYKAKSWKRNTKRLPETLSLDANSNNNTSNVDSQLTSSFGAFNNRKIQGQDDIETAYIASEGDDAISSIATQRKKQTTKADRAARFGSTNRTATYEEMKQRRIEERRLAIQDGLIPDPNAPTRLEDAIDFRGTCTTMCPEFEMVERDLQNGLDPLEMDEHGNVDTTKAVKTYRRSAAGNEQPLPSDVRPPDVLIKTLNYLMGSILIHQPLERCHPFLRDRTRSIRQDFTLQNIRDQSAVEAHERIARFHILCLHEMCELDEERFSEQQETEQLRKVLLSLMEFYEDLREDGIEMENEPEFRAYHLITHIRDPDVVRQIQTLPPNLFLHPYVQRALEFYGLMQRNNEIKESSSRKNKFSNVEASQNYYSKFFKLVGDPDTPFLMACMLEWHFPDVRKGALKAMNAAYRQMGLKVEYVREVLAYDTIDQVIEEAQVYGLIVDSTGDEPMIRFHQKHLGKKKGTFFIEPLSNPKQRQSQLLVEPKKVGFTLQEIVDGVNTISTHHSVIPSVPISQTKQSSFMTRQLPRKAAHFASNTANKPGPSTTSQQQKHDQQRQQQLQLQQQQQQQEKQRLLSERVRQRQQEIDIQLKAHQAEIEKREALLRENKERQRLEAEQKQKALAQQIRAAEQAAMEERERLERQRLEDEEKARREKELREAELARQRRAVIISQAKKRYMTQLVASVLKETTTKVIKEFHRKKCIAKQCTNPWLQRARQRIALRHAKADERIQFCIFSECFHPGNQQHSNNNTNNSMDIDMDHYSKATWYTPSSTNTANSIDNAIQDKVMLSLQLESSILASYNSTELPTDDLWKMMDYADSIYPLVRSKWDRIRTRMIEDNRQPGWQLWINVADHSLSSSHWFETKFGLNDDFSRRVKYYNDCRITIRSISNQDSVYGKAVDELGAMIFSLSELRHHDCDDLYATDHWNKEKARLQEFTATLKRYNPQVKAPFLFTYWPHTKSLKETIMKIPKLLDLASVDVISDFHILIMNPATIKERLDQEIHWLSVNSVINQPLKTNHVVTSKIRALTFAVEKTSCNFGIGVTVEDAIHSVNKQIEAYNNTLILVQVPLNWKPFVIPPIPEQVAGDREATRGDLFVLGNAWLEIVAKKGIVRSIGGAEDLGAVVDGTLKQYLYELERRLNRPLLL